MAKLAENHTSTPVPDDHIVRRKFILSSISKHIGKDKFEPAPLLNLRVLDIGCGNLGMSEALTLRGADVTAIDTCTETIEHSQALAKKLGTMVEFVKAAPGDLVMRNTPKFDLILCLDVISEVEDPKKFLWAVEKLLKDDGLLVFSDWDPAVQHRVMAKLAHIKVPQKNLPIKQLKLVLKELGLKAEGFVGLHYNPQKGEWFKRRPHSLRYMGTAHKSKLKQGS